MIDISFKNLLTKEQPELDQSFFKSNWMLHQGI